MEENELTMPDDALEAIAIQRAQAQATIDSLISAIHDAQQPRSVTNVMVADVMDFLNTSYKELASMIGKAGGIAPLGAGARMVESYLPTSCNEVICFDETVTECPELVPVRSVLHVLKTIYVKSINKFVQQCVVIGANGSETVYMYCPNVFVQSASTYVPYEGKIYIDKTTNIPYRWDGSRLVALGGSSMAAHDTVVPLQEATDD